MFKSDCDERIAVRIDSELTGRKDVKKFFKKKKNKIDWSGVPARQVNAYLEGIRDQIWEDWYKANK